jgi:Ca-activated chloride channel family protein
MKMHLRVLSSVVVGFALLVPAWSQPGPKKEGSETVAKPRKRGDAPEPERAPIESKLKKKPESETLPEGIPTFKSDATTVSVDVAILDNRGRFIPGIPKGNFRILEDGVPQQVSQFAMGEAPMTIALVIEFSNLFQQYWGQGWYETLTAVYGFVETLKPEDFVAVVAFDLRPEILSDFSTDRRKTQEALQRLRIAAFSESNMYDALVDTAERMSEIEGRKAIFYIGSGMDTFSKMTFDQCRKRLQAAGVPIYGMGIMQALREIIDARGMMGSIQRLDFLQADNQVRTFAKETGGMAYFPRFISEYPGIFGSIHNALRNQYSLSYTPTNLARDGKFRKIKVELVNPATNEPLKVTDEKGKSVKYQVVAKAGYTAPREVE